MLSDGFVAIGGFADLWLYSDSDAHRWKRDFRVDVVAEHPCPTCGAAAGQLCRRPTIAGVMVPRRLPHFGREPGRLARYRMRLVVEGR